METIFLSGPQGSGKTAIAARLAAQHGMTQIVDEWWPGKDVQPGAIHVTHAEGFDVPAGARLVRVVDLVETASH